LSDRRTLSEIAGAFTALGLSSFGGPIAHLGYFRRDFVERHRWIDDAAFADLVALCQMLPGPTSSQVVFGLGMRWAGIAGAAVASLCFMLPSAVVMTVFAYGVVSLSDPGSAGWLHGLKLAAVAIVARAVWGMAGALCPDWPRRILAVVGAALVLCVPGPLTQLGVIAAFGAMAALYPRKEADPPLRAPPDAPGGHAWAVAALALFFLLLGLLPVLSRGDGEGTLAVFDRFYRTGAVVFGGGHVVLPLLRAEVVPPGWISDGAFLAGYGAVQAVPGPLFTFAAYVGTLIGHGPWAWCTGALALFAIFLPGWLLVGGAYPFWGAMVAMRGFRGFVRGANVAVVGILLAALYSPIGTEGVRSVRDGAAVVIAILLMARLRLPQWALVALMAAAGQWLLR